MKTLVDTGLLVGFLSATDKYHAWAIDLVAQLPAPFLTCEAVLSEATFLTRPFNGGAALMGLVSEGLVRPTFRLHEEASAVQGLLKRYASVPMDLADACLVRMTETHPDCELLTIDTEFRDIYRRRGRQVIPCKLPPDAPTRSRKRTPTRRTRS
jgi:predicted nucleic acid-binding protein